MAALEDQRIDDLIGATRGVLIRLNEALKHFTTIGDFEDLNAIRNHVGRIQTLLHSWHDKELFMMARAELYRRATKTTNERSTELSTAIQRLRIAKERLNIRERQLEDSKLTANQLYRCNQIEAAIMRRTAEDVERKERSLAKERAAIVLRFNNLGCHQTQLQEYDLRQKQRTIALSKRERELDVKAKCLDAQEKWLIELANQFIQAAKKADGGGSSNVIVSSIKQSAPANGAIKVTTSTEEMNESVNNADNIGAVPTLSRYWWSKKNCEDYERMEDARRAKKSARAATKGSVNEQDTSLPIAKKIGFWESVQKGKIVRV